MRAYIGSFAVLLLSSGMVSAAGAPADLPPKGYIGRGFVDSAGCAFTRAEMDDTVVWVARLDATRTAVCDETPTFAGPSERLIVTSPVAVSVAPRAVVKTKRAAPTATPTAARAPTGFKRAWDDGRLNPNRGPRTAAGNAAMARVWNDKVPMARRSN